MSQSELESLSGQLADFASQRDWEQFHSPKNLAMALAVEAAELLEIFQWQSEQQSRDADRATRERAGEELADILLYSLLLCDKLDIDLAQAAQAKLQRNAEKYPADRVRGSARKYNEY